jgi:2-oxoglutarate dehydrogenase E1 component
VPEQPNDLSLAFVEGLYEQFLRDPGSVSADWRAYFTEAARGDRFASRPQLGPSFGRHGLFDPPAGDGAPAAGGLSSSELSALQHKVDRLIRNYRVRGHIMARLDPLGLPRPRPPECDPLYYGFTDAEMDRELPAAVRERQHVVTLRQLMDKLNATYCRSIGVQFMHIDDLVVREWLQSRMESSENRLALSREEQLTILTRLTDAVIFEQFVQKKFLGAKSFSLEGAESLIPLLHLLIEKAGAQGVDEIVLGMAHRGRLNVLANILGKSPRRIFQEFEDKHPDLHRPGGDVKYHLGHSSDWTTAEGRRLHLSLCFNPSHLEFVNPVALGRVRSKQDGEGDAARTRGLAVMIHGDAAFAGQGVVQETLNLSELPGYTTGGSVHVIVNNQIGFTTGPDEARSTVYATDVAKMLQSPIFHVNGEDPEAVAQVVKLAMEFRATFRRDVVIDMYGYRRHGHNESDEPAYTQPVLYHAIRRRKPVRDGYLDHLLALGGITGDEAEEIVTRRRAILEEELASARSEEAPVGPSSLAGVWTGYRGGPDAEVKEGATGVRRERLVELLEAQTRFPQGFRVHPNLDREMTHRRAMAAGERPLSWAMGEALAFGSLAQEGHRVRLTGQDAARGTFSHRHAVLRDYHDGRPHLALAHVAPDQAPVEIVNSPLSEVAVLAFEYGYSLDAPDALVLWEAQFGDFWNVAQCIVDQFIASAEAKWSRLSGLVMLLPHGFEGQGPEHSSARLERFLAIAAQDNIQVVQPTTPAQYFHMLRRQVVRPIRKPLVVMTPKSLLRNPQAVSALDDLAHDRFHRILSDGQVEARAAKRVLLCSGKMYYDLEQRRTERKRTDVAILRFEQLYPLAEEEVAAALAPYGEGTPVTWVQEEPENMGAWRYVKERFGATIGERHPFGGVCREASASPATGSPSRHHREQSALVAKAFGEEA